MKLYGAPPSRGARPLWLIKELSLDCEVVPVDVLKGENLTPEYLALNPAGKVPILVDGDFVLVESMAIALYLAEKFPDKGLIPNDLQERAEMYRWLFFLVSEIEGPLWRISRHSMFYPESERRPEEVELARREGRQMVAVLEKHMQDREYLVGNSLTVADMMAAYTLDWANHSKFLEEAPRLKAFVKRMYERSKAPPDFATSVATQSATHT